MSVQATDRSAAGQNEGIQAMISFTRREALILSGAAILLPAATIRAEDAPSTIWDLSDLFPTAAAWTIEHDAVLVGLTSLTSYKGRLGESPDILRSARQTNSDLNRRLARLTTYATLKGDENLQDSVGQELRSKAVALGEQVSEAGAWLNPELLALGADKINAFISADPGLAKFRFGLWNVLRQAAHTLNAQGELLLASATQILAGPELIRSQLVLSDIPWPIVTLSTGELRIDEQGYTIGKIAADRNDRKKVFDAFYGTFKVYDSSLGAALSAHINGDVFQARMRLYPNALTEAISEDNIPEGVYRTLVAETHEGLGVLQRYFEIRRRLMGLSELAYYDLAPPITKLDRRFDLATIRATVLHAVAPLGPDYVSLLGNATASNWMHAFPQKGKAAGAYMNAAAYDVHPYLLLNLSDDYESMSTYAHEWGHAMHSLLANKMQPFETSDYSIFIAEIASTVNEQLLAEHLYRTAETKEEKLFFLDQVCELLRTTFYRQAMFGEFELAIHEMAEKGESLSGEKLTATYYNILKNYHGSAVSIDQLYGEEWAAPPHFYYNFYVYQYATSIAAAVYFSDQILNGSVNARENYLNVLRAGASDYPTDILKRAGLDMTTSVPYRALVVKFSRTLDEIEKLLNA
jgi:oligoendopeptidase F